MVKAFADESYPFRAGHWSEFENTQFPKITSIEVPEIVSSGEELNINIETSQTDSILYFLNSNSGELVSSEQISVDGEKTQITISKELTQKLGNGANDLKVFAISDSVLKPDFHSTSFLAVDEKSVLPQITPEEFQFIDTEEAVMWVIIPIIGIIIVVGVLVKKHRKTYSVNP